MKNILSHNIIAMSEALKGWCEADVRGFSLTVKQVLKILDEVSSQ